MLIDSAMERSMANGMLTVTLNPGLAF